MITSVDTRRDQTVESFDFRSPNRFLIINTIVAALGGLLFGFDTAVIAGTTEALKSTFQLSSWSLGLTVSVALWGTVIGALTAGYPGDRIGRRDTLRVLALLYVVSALGCGLAFDWNALAVFRFMEGLAIGGSSVLGPMYIAEIAPAKWRGRLVGFFQMNVVLGIMLAYLSNAIIAAIHFGPSEWRWKLGIAALPAALFFLMLFRIPRSPRWLAAKGRLEEARIVIEMSGNQRADEEIQEILSSLNYEKASDARLFTRKHMLPIFLAVSIGMFNQLTGINAILYYINDIFRSAGFSSISSDIQSVCVGSTLLVFTLLGTSVIDHFGRKKLLLLGSVGTSICLAAVAWVFVTKTHEKILLLLLVCYIAFFALSQGAVIWVYISEVFPNHIRAKGQSLGSFSHWIMNAIISAVFPAMAASLGGYAFAFFSAMMVVQLLVILMFYPETKGISLERMERKLGVN